MTDLCRFEWEKEAVKIPDQEELRYYSLKYGNHVDDKGNFYNA
jgi:hypothetical protein